MDPLINPGVSGHCCLAGTPGLISGSNNIREEIGAGLSPGSRGTVHEANCSPVLRKFTERPGDVHPLYTFAAGLFPDDVCCHV